MDCSICLAAIETGTSSATTSCGHTFHFGCLASWSRTKSSCPLCRQAFTETDTPLAVDIRSFLTVESRRLTPGEVETFRREVQRDLQRELQDRYMLRPLEWVVFEGPDPVDIAFIVEKTDLDAQSAKAYLAFYKNPVELINQITWKGDLFPIPEFRPRNRGDADSYVPRSIAYRTGRTTLTLEMYENGYESA